MGITMLESPLSPTPIATWGGGGGGPTKKKKKKPKKKIKKKLKVQIIYEHRK